MLSDKEKKILEKKIKNISSTNQKITILLTEKLKKDLEDRGVLKKNIKTNIKQCNGDILYIYNIANDMWYLAGDQSSDYNFYTKRIILSGILSKLYFKILSLNNYDEEKLIEDIKTEIKKVGKFNKFKSEIISAFQSLKDKSFSKNSGRGY